MKGTPNAIHTRLYSPHQQGIYSTQNGLLFVGVAIGLRKLWLATRVRLLFDSAVGVALVTSKVTCSV
jgi:hypothetical protein